jgi:hypothetical protein
LAAPIADVRRLPVGTQHGTVDHDSDLHDKISEPATLLGSKEALFPALFQFQEVLARGVDTRLVWREEVASAAFS